MSKIAQVEFVGILNLSPNSIDGGVPNQRAALERAEQLFKDGASIVDVGGEATNPWADPITATEEWRRLEPVLTELVPRYPGLISVDTHHPQTVHKAAALGEIIINDVTTFRDPRMIEAALEVGALCIVSHLPDWVEGDILLAHRSKDRLMDSAAEVKHEVLARVDKMLAAGIAEENIIVDPGIGFGKTSRLNWGLLSFAKVVRSFPVLIGHSQKRFLETDRTTGKEVPGAKGQKNEDEMNIKAAKKAMATGARYLRVHKPAIYQNL
jgi:dihydropteroate synthase